MRKLVLSLVVAAVLVMAACAPSAPLPPAMSPEMDEGAPRSMMPPPVELPPSGGTGWAKDDVTETTILGQPWANRLIVRNGEVSLVVEDTAMALERITWLAEEMGGYVVSSKTWGEGKHVAGSISIRVPALHFDDTLRALRALAIKVLSEDTSSKDVTEEYVDLESRRRNLEVTERQLLKLMERAETVEEALKVQRELTQIQGEIEQTKGRMQYLERSSETSLIRVSLQGANLDAEFVTSRIEVKAGSEVYFTDHSRGGFPPYKYEWDFGDGATGTVKNPRHVYDLPGAYTISLQVTDDKGNNDIEIRKAYIIVAASPGWDAGGVAKGAARALGTLGRGLGNAVIWLAIFLPVWGPVAGILYWRWRRRQVS